VPLCFCYHFYGKIKFIHRPFVFADENEDLTKAPDNTLVLRGQDAMLYCTSSPTDGQNPIVWDYDLNIITYTPCTSQNPGFVASPPDSATECNIQALGTWEHGISGAYRCNGKRVRAVAMVIVLGK